VGQASQFGGASAPLALGEKHLTAAGDEHRSHEGLLAIREKPRDLIHPFRDGGLVSCARVCILAIRCLTESKGYSRKCQRETGENAFH